MVAKVPRELLDSAAPINQSVGLGLGIDVGHLFSGTDLMLRHQKPSALCILLVCIYYYFNKEILS